MKAEVALTVESTTVHVGLSERSYDIHIGLNNLSTIGELAGELGDISHVVVITDSNVRDLYGETVLKSLSQNDFQVDIMTVPAGESSKSVSILEELWQQMLSLGADRKTVIVALGGGVVGDLAGFVAASYGRGVRFIQIPTTLLATVDSSVGGKVGINLPGAKNMVGAFWQPQAVLIDVAVLESLPARDYHAGLAEVVKYGVIQDEDFFNQLENNVGLILERDAEFMRDVIARCCELKAYVVENDERETSGLRAILNYGHTFCHAIEACAGYGTYMHGEAVAIGMLCASRLAEALGRITSEDTARQHNLLVQLNLPIALPQDLKREPMVEAMKRDKKTEHGKIRFILPTRIGHVELVDDVDEALALAAFN
ncbi:MAG: 3-dehydroquinate synthase [Planctomycetaceae bacterium]|nr:3-dehydroquinate synthase [Planctomycetaceae bacterium]|tara:strand:+ start:3629 stop:4738 length:1110 start_codon:yes stop_codon:yes gene_type:complete